jgi:hypothetical protein
MKRQFILFFGASWCGTTSLYYTLTRSQKYLHTGIHKECGYLRRIFDPTFVYKTDVPLMALKDVDFFLEHYESIKSRTLNLNPDHFHYDYFKIGYKFSKDEVEKLFKVPSIENYVEYYLKLSEYIGNDYTAVADFSNCNQLVIEEKFLTNVKQVLSEHFDVKVLLMLRDPVRRCFSIENSSYYRKHLISNTIEVGSPERYHRPENFIELASNKSVTNYLIENIMFNKNYLSSISTNYANVIGDLNSIFGSDNVCYLIMEDFFNKKKDEISKLEQFISYKLEHIHPCVFVPDKGINAPKLDFLEDQHTSDWEILTEDLYNYMRKFFSPIYDDFEKFHGCLPADWGTPIDYGY